MKKFLLIAAVIASAAVPALAAEVNLVFNNGQVVNIDSAELEMKALRGQLRPVQFWSIPTVWSVFG